LRTCSILAATTVGTVRPPPGPTPSRRSTTTAGCRASSRAPTPRLRHVVGPAPGDGAADPGDALVEDTAVTADILNMGLHWLGCRRRTARRRVAPRPPQWLLGAVVGVGDEAIERWSTLRSRRWPCCLLFPCSRRSLEPASMPRRRDAASASGSPPIRRAATAATPPPWIGEGRGFAPALLVGIGVATTRSYR
jgi:hypothetical protein